MTRNAVSALRLARRFEPLACQQAPGSFSHCKPLGPRQNSAGTIPCFDGNAAVLPDGTHLAARMPDRNQPPLLVGLAAAPDDPHPGGAKAGSSGLSLGGAEAALRPRFAKLKSQIQATAAGENSDREEERLLRCRGNNVRKQPKPNPFVSFFSRVGWFWF